MGMDEFKDRMFDMLNDTDDFSIADIVADDRDDRIYVYLSDGAMFVIHFERHGHWR